MMEFRWESLPHDHPRLTTPGSHVMTWQGKADIGHVTPCHDTVAQSGHVGGQGWTRLACVDMYRQGSMCTHIGHNVLIVPTYTLVYFRIVEDWPKCGHRGLFTYMDSVHMCSPTRACTCAPVPSPIMCACSCEHRLCSCVHVVEDERDIRGHKGRLTRASRTCPSSQ